MHRSAPRIRRTASRDRAIRARSAVAALVVVTGMLAGCVATPAEESQAQVIAASAAESPVFTLTAPEGILVSEDVLISEFGAGEGVAVDVCHAVDETGRVAVDPRPAVLAIHGGSWARGDKAHPYWRTICERLAAEGFVGVSVNYRLAPEHPYPAAAIDVRAAVAWAQDAQVGKRFGIDGQRVALLGGSAGGNLAALVGLELAATAIDPDAPLQPVDAVVTLSAPLDLTAGAVTGPELEPAMLDYLACVDLADCPAALDASPQHRIVRGAPPFYLVHASRESLVPIGQAVPFATALRQAGVAVEFDLIEGEAHSIGLLDEDLARRIIAFLRDRLITPLGIDPIEEQPTDGVTDATGSGVAGSGVAEDSAAAGGAAGAAAAP